MKWLASFFVLSSCITMLASCKRDANPVGESNPILWTQEELRGLEIRGVCSFGNAIIAGAYLPNTSYAFLFTSTDNGVTWVRTDSVGLDNHSPNLGLWVYPFFAFTVYGGDIFVGVGGGLSSGDMYRSTDGGMNWTDEGINWPESKGNGNENIQSFCISGESLFAGTLHGTFFSTDHGTTWKAANTGLTFPVVALTSVGTSIFAGTNSEGIFLSTNNGSAWSMVNSTDYFFMSLAAIGSKVFAGAFQLYERPLTGGVFVTTDNGTNWTHSDSGLTNHELNVLISNGINLYAGTNCGTFFSTDQGTSWGFISTGSPADSMVVLSLAVNNSRLVVGTLGGVWFYKLSDIFKSTSMLTRQTKEPRRK